MTFGSWFKNNWINCIKTLGATATTVGFTGAMIRDMKKGGGCCSNTSIFRGWGGFNMYSNPMSFMNYGNMSGMFNLDSMANSQYGANAAYLAGAQAFQNQYMQTVLSGAYQQIPSFESEIDVSAFTPADAPKMSNACAEAIASNQNTTLGNAIVGAMKTDTGSYKFEGLTNENYKEQFSNVGKSFGAVLDTNNDGFVSEAEFIASEVKNVPTEKTEAMRGFAKIAFNKIDINGDGKLDWKELAANFAAYDSYGYKIDGNITNAQFRDMGKKLGTAGQNEADTQLRRAYKTLFSEESE